MKKLAFISLITIALLSSSCQKYDTGNAHMQTIDFVIQNSDWVEYGTLGNVGYGFAVDIDMPEITENVVQNGMASLYMKSGDSWLQVPIYFYDDGFQGGYIYALKRGIFSIEYYESDHKTVKPGTQIYRLVIVQPV